MKTKKTARSAREQYGRMYEIRSILFLGFGISGVLAGIVGVGLSIASWVKEVLYNPGIYWLTVASGLAFGMGIACLVTAWDSRAKVLRCNGEGQWKRIARELRLQKTGWLVVGVVMYVVIAVYGFSLFISSAMETTPEGIDRSFLSFFRYEAMTLVWAILVGIMIGLSISFSMILYDTAVFRRMLRSESEPNSE